MLTTLYILEIVFAVVLVGVVLLQAKGGGLGGLMGSDSSVFRTRRGLEQLLFRFTVVWAALFVLLSMITARVATGS